PVLMAASLLLGILVAVAHHLFYRSLDGQVVSSDDQQEWFFRIGTGLAFASRILLAIAVGLSYTQVLWYTLRTQSVSLEGLDSLFGAANNVWHLTTWELWKKGPALAIIAVIICMLPFTAVITPATLSIRLAAQPNQSKVQYPIPSVNYDVSEIHKWAQIIKNSNISYYGPSSRVVRLMSAVASQGSVLPIVPSHPNCTYFLEFYGPALKCNAPKDAIKSSASFPDEVWAQIHDWTCNPSPCRRSAIAFASYVPLDPANSFQTLAAAALYGLNVTLKQPTFKLNLTTVDLWSRDLARIYVTLPSLLAPGQGAGWAGDDWPTWAANTTLECGLYNASYAVNFTFVNGQQNVTVENKIREGVSSSQAQTICPELNGIPCTGDATAYVAIMDSLGMILQGYISVAADETFDPVNTQITRSVMIETTEMQYLEQPYLKTAGLSIANMTMAMALEDIVLNTTLSLFSDAYFLQNSTLAPMRPITVNTSQNAYVYSPRNLFIAYGLGFLFATAVVAVAFFLIWASGNSFGASFSVILRTTRNPELDEVVGTETQGALPMSKELGRRQLVLRREAHGP
ncbi:hypothetical protein GQ53DRAFT_619752, partial [Thozetella sp. PMI_491]